MLVAFRIIWILIFSFHSNAIEWNEYKPRLETESPFSFYRGKLDVPVDYIPPPSFYSNTISHGLKIHIRKICNNTNPEWNIVLLPGGPGQDAEIYIKMISRISDALKDVSYCLYAIDHRGVGKSTPKLIEEDDSGEWIEKIKEINNNPNFPLKTLTITNAAMDVLALAEYLRESMPNSKLGLIGQSYGSMLAHRILSIEPEMFDVCIFDGYSTFENYSLDNDEGLIFECKNSPTCKRKLGSHPEHIRLVSSYLINRNLNKYTEILHEFLDNKSNLKGLNRKERLQRYFHIASFEFEHYKALMIMIHHTWTCPNPETFKTALKTFGDLISQEENEDGMKESNKENGENENVNKDKNESESESKNESEILQNQLVFGYLNLSEIHRMDLEGDGPDNCVNRNYPIGLVNLCASWKEMKMKYDLIKSFLYMPDYLKSCLNEFHGSKLEIHRNRLEIKKCKLPLINTVKTRIYLIHGRLDLNTPIEPALREFDRIKSLKGKRKFIFDYGDHGIFFENPCKYMIMDEIFNNGSEIETDECIKEINDSMKPIESEELNGNLNVLWAEGDSLRPLPSKPCDDETCINK